MNAITIRVLKGVCVALIVAAPLWWLPIFLQQVISDFWLAVMTMPPVMLGGYVAASRALRPILTGVLSGLVSMLLISSVSVSTEEVWVVPAMIFLGCVFAALGAYVAIWAGHARVRK